MEQTIYLAGGCFWGVEAYYSRLKGVLETRVGYANGKTIEPTYLEVRSQRTGHAETVEVIFEDSIRSLEQLLGHFLRFVDPYSLNKQGHDEGTQYRSGVYCLDKDQIDRVKAYFDANLKPGYVIEVEPLKCFYEAEDYHQDYLEKNPGGYCHVNLNLIQKNESK